MSGKKKLVIPHGEHPDGDPFEDKDSISYSTSALGRMEAKAKLELERPTLSNTSTSLPPPSSQSTKVIEVIQLDDTDDESEDDTEDERSQSSIEVKDEQQPVAGSEAEEEQQDGDESSAQATGDEEDSSGDDDSEEEDDDDSDDSEDGESSSTESVNKADVSLAPASEDVIMTNAAHDEIATSPLKSTSIAPTTSSKAAAAAVSASAPPSPLSLLKSPASRLSTLPPAISDSPLLPSAIKEAPAPPPEPPKPKLPPRTIRLSIVLPRNVPDVPEYSVAELAKEAGFIEAVEAVDEKKSTSGVDDGEDSTSEMEVGKEKGKQKEPGDNDKMQGIVVIGADGINANIDGTAIPPPKKKQRRREPNKILGRYGGYDVEDPFVDDSEIQLFEPQFYHRPVREGYFVCTGSVEVIPEKTGRGRVTGSKNKQKYDKDGNLVPATRKKSTNANGTTAAEPSTSKASGSGTTTNPAAKHRKDKVEEELVMASSIPAFGNGNPSPKKKKKGVFSPEMQIELDMLRAEVAKESFEVKNKFPPRLRPILVEVGLRAIEMEEYDDDFFAILPKIFPYNNFTMKKLLKREIYPKRLANMQADQEVQLQTLRDGIDELLPKQRAEWEALHAGWEKEQEGREEEVERKRKRMEEESLRQDQELDTPEPEENGTIGESQTSAAPPVILPPVGDDDVKMDSPTGEDAAEEGTGHDQPEPKWKFRFSEQMRMALWRLYSLEDEISNLTIEKQGLEKSTEKPHSILASRKALYSKVAALWPHDTINNNELSRQVSIMKKKVDREKERDAAAT